MRKIFLLTVNTLFTVIVFSQTASPDVWQGLRENVAVFFKQGDPDFSGTTAPANWTKQSAVILSQKTNIAFDQKTSHRFLGPNKKNVFILEQERRRVLLLDQSAVESFSELYFDAGDKENGFDGRIIKPDGQVIAIELEKSVPVEEEKDVPSLFKSYTASGGHKFYKLPVNNLEIGDIVEYAYQVNNDAGTYGSFIEFEPIYYGCHRFYSVVKQKFEIKLDKNTFLNSRSVNGAPEFKESLTGESNIYTWEDGNRERIKNTLFLNQNLQLPLVKFQIVYSDKENAKNLFIGNRGELKKSLTPEELTKKASNMFGGALNYARSEMGSATTHLRKMDALSSKEELYIASCYYVLRHNYALGKSGRMSGALFAAMMKQLLDQRKIESKTGITSRNIRTKPEDIIFRSEVEWFIEIRGKYIFAPTSLSHINDIPSWAQGNKGYMLPANNEKEVVQVEIPVVPYSENHTLYTYDVSMAPDSLDLLLVKAKHTLKNENRINASEQVLEYELYEPDDWRTYGGWDDKETLSQSQLDNLNEKIANYRKEARKLKPEFMKEQLKDDFDEVVKYERFRLVQDGRNMRKQELIYEEDFTLGEMIQHAGKSILVRIPGFLSNQLQITGDERVRQFDAMLPTQRSFTYQIRFTVPEGYKVLGLSNLNKSVDNETGSFTAKATFENGVVVIEAKKIYKQKTVSKDNWPKMLEWLDEAYNFSQQRILLRK